MSLRSCLIAIASLVAGVALLALLVAVSGLRSQQVLAQFAAMDRLACFRLAGLVAVNTFLSSLKWQLTDRALRHTSDGSPSQFESFALTSIGTALGQVLPAQLSMPAARTLGTRIYGRAFERGTLGTFFEQSFDLLFACFLMFGSAAVYLLHLGWRMWFAITVAGAVLAIVSVGAMLNLAKRLAAGFVAKGTNLPAWRRFAVKFSESTLLEPALGRKLMFLSAIRFAVLVLMAGETTAAIHADIPLWHFAAVMPFAFLAMASGITPGGLGLSELTYATILSALGTPLSVTAPWALANRLLTAGSSMAIATVLLPFFFVFRVSARASEFPAP